MSSYYYISYHLFNFIYLYRNRIVKKSIFKKEYVKKKKYILKEIIKVC